MRRLTHPIFLVSDDDFGENMLCLCLALMTLLLHTALPSCSFVTMASLKPNGIERVKRWTRKSVQRREEDYFMKLLRSLDTRIDLELDEESMKPEKAPEAPKNARRDPITMNMKKWYQGQNSRK